MIYYEEQPPNRFEKFMFIFMFTFAVLVILIVSLSGCAPMTEQQQYEQDNALVLSREAYEAAALACDRAGGAVSVKRRSSVSRIPRPFTKFELDSAECRF